MKILIFLIVFVFFPSTGFSWGTKGDSEAVKSQPTTRTHFRVGSAQMSGECRISSSGCTTDSKIKVDVANNCMCIGSRCHKIARGSRPTKTYNGTGTIGLTSGVYNRKGGKYRTHRGASTAADDDALAMGIPSNDRFGIWFHKPMRGGRCVPVSQKTTAGCIAVPCDLWPSFKKAALGSSVTVCGGAGSGTGYKGGRGSKKGGKRTRRRDLGRYNGKTTPTGRPNLKTQVSRALSSPAFKEVIKNSNGQSVK